MRVTLLCGGSSSEREVSLMAACEISGALDPGKYEVTVVEVPAEDTCGGWIAKLAESRPELVVPLLRGGIGADGAVPGGAVQGLLECSGFRYTGSRVLGSALCMDKAMSKSVLRSYNIPVPDDVLIPAGEPFGQYRNAISRMGFPGEVKVIVKPGRGGAGVSIAGTWDELEALFDQAAGGSVSAEQFIPGRGISCGLLETREGLRVLPLPELPPFVRGMAERIARQAFVKLRCGGYATADMVVRGEQVYVIGVDTRPVLTPSGVLPKAAALCGWSFPRLMDILIRNA